MNLIRQYSGILCILIVLPWAGLMAMVFGTPTWREVSMMFASFGLVTIYVLLLLVSHDRL